MAKSAPTPQELLARLDARHDALIARLDELNVEIERALKDLAQARGQSAPQAA